METEPEVYWDILYVIQVACSIHLLDVEIHSRFPQLVVVSMLVLGQFLDSSRSSLVSQADGEPSN